MADNPLHDQVVEIEEEIATNKATIKKERHQQRLFALGIFGILVATVIFAYIGHFIPFSNVNSHDANKSFIPVAYIIIGAMGGFLGFTWIIVSVQIIVTAQTTIAFSNAEIGIWEAKKRVVSQFAALSEKPSYFESLVRINVENLAAYYTLVRVHTDNSYKVAIRICIFGFLLIVTGLVIGLIDFTNAHIVSYISSGAGVITEFISSIFFYLYNRTVRQMKEYHDSLLTVQNILLSFKLVEDTPDESEKAKIVSQMLAALITKQNAPTLTSDLPAQISHSTANGTSK